MKNYVFYSIWEDNLTIQIFTIRNRGMVKILLVFWIAIMSK